MYARLVQLLAAQHGLVTRGQVLDTGLPPSRITQLLHEGHLVTVRRGVYADGAAWRELDEYLGRPRLRTRAAVLTMRRGWVLSHDSVALEVEMPLLDPARSLVHITRPGFSAAWTRAGVSHHYARFTPAQVVETADGFRRLSIARTAVDLAREHGELAGLVACDWVLRQGVPRAELVETYLPMAHWPGVVDVRAAVERADGRAESAAESLGRDLVEELGLDGEIDLQFPVQVETGRVVWCDIRIGNHVFEVQGRIKYLPLAEGGVAQRTPTDVVWEEKKRSRLVRAVGLGLSEILWEDFWGDKRKAALERLAAEYAVTEARFGPDLAPHLAAQAEQIRARHGRRDRATGGLSA